MRENEETFPRKPWICSLNICYCNIYHSKLDVSFRCDEVKLTYDGNLFDIPGGRTDGREPATRTAERETFEESGYQVSWDGWMAVLPKKTESVRMK